MKKTSSTNNAKKAFEEAMKRAENGQAKLDSNIAKAVALRKQRRS